MKDTIRLKYCGPHSACSVAGLGTVKRGQEYDVPHKLAGDLLRTYPDGWKKVKVVASEHPSSAPKRKTKKED